MRIDAHADAARATRAAADYLSWCLTQAGARTLMVAGGNSPLALYRDVAARSLPLRHLTVFALDEYVGVPSSDPRTCANLLRREVRDAWKIPAAQYHALDSSEAGADGSLRELERRISGAGGLDAIVLGLGKNGHLGFNEPGSAPDSPGRIAALDPVSTEANRSWFGGDYAPSRGATVGLRTILSARRVILLAFGAGKAGAVARMSAPPPARECPASWLQNHPDARCFVDAAAGSRP